MAISLASLQRTKIQRPPICLFHGGPGIGKTTFCAAAPDSAWIRTEDGLGNLEVNSFPLAKNWADVMDAMTALYSEDHNLSWVVLDSLSALEGLIWAQVARDENKTSVEAIPFGKGYGLALDYWRQLMDGISALGVERGMGALLIAHSDIVRFQSPETDSYDRVQIKLHKSAFQFMHERCDVIGYAAPQVFVRKEEAGFDKKRSIAATSGKRFLHLVEKPAYVAKNRYSMPETIPLEWDTFSAALSGPAAPAKAASK